MMRRLPTVGPDNEPLWVRLYVHPLGDHWAAMIVADDASPPGPDTVTGLTCFGATPEVTAPELVGLAWLRSVRGWGRWMRGSRQEVGAKHCKARRDRVPMPRATGGTP